MAVKYSKYVTNTGSVDNVEVDSYVLDVAGKWNMQNIFKAGYGDGNRLYLAGEECIKVNSEPVVKLSLLVLRRMPYICDKNDFLGVVGCIVRFRPNECGEDIGVRIVDLTLLDKQGCFSNLSIAYQMINEDLPQIGYICYSEKNKGITKLGKSVFLGKYEKEMLKAISNLVDVFKEIPFQVNLVEFALMQDDEKEEFRKSDEGEDLGELRKASFMEETKGMGISLISEGNGFRKEGIDGSYAVCLIY